MRQTFFFFTVTVSFLLAGNSKQELDLEARICGAVLEIETSKSAVLAVQKKIGANSAVFVEAQQKDLKEKQASLEYLLKEYRDVAHKPYDIKKCDGEKNAKKLAPLYNDQKLTDQQHEDTVFSALSEPMMKKQFCDLVEAAAMDASMLDSQAKEKMETVRRMYSDNIKKISAHYEKNFKKSLTKNDCPKP